MAIAKYMTLNDLEWPFYVKYLLLRTAFSAVRLHTYREAIHRIFLLHDFTSRDMRKWTVIRRILREARAFPAAMTTSTKVIRHNIYF